MNIDSIRQAICESERPEAFYYYSIFRSKLGEEDPEWRLLFDLFGMSDNFKDPDEPFRPMVVMGGKRSFLPEDLNDTQVELLRGDLQEVDDPEFQARINDVLWLVRNDHRAARKAIDAYLQSASRLEDTENWPPSADRYGRAFQLARQIDRKGQLPEQVMSKFIERIRFYDGNDPRWLTYRLMYLLYEARKGDVVELGLIAQKTADRVADARTRRDYLDLVAKFAHRAQLPAEAEAARVAIAQTYLAEADEAEERGGGLAAHHHLEAALAAFRERPSLRDELPALKRRLANAATSLLGAMQSHSREIDIRDLVEEVRNRLTGLPLDEGLFSFVSLPLMDPIEMRNSVEGRREGFLASLFESRFFDYDGRVVAIAPGAFQPTDPGYDERVQADIQRDASFRRHLMTRAQIVPGLQVLKSEHVYDLQVLGDLLSGVEIIPDNRRPLLLRGLNAGFDWDFTLATHLLIPALEAALRHIAETNGIVPRNMNASGIEDAWGYERLLSEEGIRAILGEHLTFELRSLLIDMYGPKLRHNMAHGLVPAAVYEGHDAVYFWWLTLRVALVPSPQFQAFKKTLRRETDSIP